MSKQRTQYSEEFKKEAVKMANRLGFAQAARDLGVNHNLIRRWAKKQSSPKSNESQSQDEVEAENRKLRKENEYLKKINEVLKKSTAIFSKDHMGNSK